MSDQGVFLLKWPPNWRIILAKEQLGHSYTFWTMPTMILSPVSNFGDQSLCLIWYIKQVANFATHPLETNNVDNDEIIPYKKALFDTEQAIENAMWLTTY